MASSQKVDETHLRDPQNQPLGVCNGFVPDIQACGTHGREDLVNATITSNAEEEEEEQVRVEGAGGRGGGGTVQIQTEA